MASSGFFVTNLHEAIEKSRLSKAEIARRANISRPTLDGYLRGEQTPGIDKLLDLANALEVDASVLIRDRLKKNNVEIPKHLESVIKESANLAAKEVINNFLAQSYASGNNLPALRIEANQILSDLNEKELLVAVITLREAYKGIQNSRKANESKKKSS